MGWVEAAVTLMGTVVALMFIGMPVAFAFLATNVLGVVLFMGGLSGVNQLIANGANAITTFTLVPIPLFVLMGSLFFHTGLVMRVFDALDMCFGGLRGRLSYLTVAGGTLFAALSGSSMANTAMLGSLMVPEMTRRGYKPHMSMGPILGTGGLAIIIPPSTLAVLLGSLARIDIGALLIAGILPGLVLALLYFALIFVQLRIDPDAAPQYGVKRRSPFEVLRALAVNILPMGLVIFSVVGLIILGVATPTEAAAFGAVSVAVLALLFRVLTWRALAAAAMDTVQISVMIFLILIGSSTFSQLLAFSGATEGLVSWAAGFDLSGLSMLLWMFLVLFVLGMFMDQLSMMLLTLPVFMPLAQTFGFDPVWFGIIVLLALEISLTTPPFGLLLFIMMGIGPPGTTLPVVARAALPYIGCALLVVALVAAYPPLALFLPSLLD